MSEPPSSRFLVDWDGMEEFKERGGEIHELGYYAVNADRDSIDRQISVYQTDFGRGLFTADMGPGMIMEASYDETDLKIFDYEPSPRDMLTGHRTVGDRNAYMVQVTTEEDVNEAVGGMDYIHRIVGLLSNEDLGELESVLFQDEECEVQIYRGENPDVIIE